MGSGFTSRPNAADWQVWKMPPEGGEAIQLIHQNGSGLVPSPDGKFVYYAKSQDLHVELWRVGADGANEEPVPGFNKKT
jgi:hypothetical protein